MSDAQGPVDLAARLEKHVLSRPRIVVSNRDNKSLLAEFRDAFLDVAQALDIYRFAGGLVMVRTTQRDAWIEPLRPEVMRGLLERAVEPIRGTSEGQCAPASVPSLVVQDLLAVPDERIASLSRIVRVPTMLRTGRFVESPGLDVDSGVYYARPVDFDLQAIPSDPSAWDIEAARLLLIEELFGDFSFEDPSDLANAIALILTPLLREFFDGPSPLFAIEADRPGTGKTLLAQIASVLITGNRAGIMAMPPSEDQLSKKITAVLREGREFLAFDNVAHVVDSASLAALATATDWVDRVLQTSSVVRLPNMGVCLLTGNRIELSREIARRCVRIQLAPHRDGAAQEFTHPDLEAWTSSNRGVLLWAALTFIRRWIACGQPRSQIRFKSYVSWAAVVGGVLEAVGIEDFLGNRERHETDIDAESMAERSFFEQWARSHRAKPVGARDLLDLAHDAELPCVLNRPSTHHEVTALGRFLSRVAKHSSLLPPGFVLNRSEDRAAKSWLYVLRVRAQSADGGVAEDAAVAPRAPRSVSAAMTRRAGGSGGSGGWS